jgi:hypothetical protein
VLSGAHLKRIAIRKVRRDIAVIGDRDIWAFLSQMDVVSVVSEPMRKQTDSEILAARNESKQHRVPPKRKYVGYSTNLGVVPVAVSLWKNVDRLLGRLILQFRLERSEMKTGTPAGAGGNVLLGSIAGAMSVPAPPQKPIDLRFPYCCGTGIG